MELVADLVRILGELATKVDDELFAGVEAEMIWIFPRIFQQAPEERRANQTVGLDRDGVGEAPSRTPPVVDREENLSVDPHRRKPLLRGAVADLSEEIRPPAPNFVAGRARTNPRIACKNSLDIAHDLDRRIAVSG